MIFHILCAILIWTGASVIYFCHAIGQKNRPVSKMQMYCEYVVLAPVMLITIGIGRIGKY